MAEQPAPGTMPRVTAYLCAKGAAEAIDFYKKAFGAEEIGERIAGDEGTIGHAMIRIGATEIMIADEYPGMGVLSPATLKGNSVSFVLDVSHADAAFAQAVATGAEVERPLQDEFFGRAGWVIDPFGHRWCITASAGSV